MGFLNKLKSYLLAWGIPGLFFVAFLDSSAIPLAGGPDAIVLLLSWQRPGQAALIVMVATLGSVLGSVVLYYIGRGGGELALAKFTLQKRQWVKAKLDQNAFWAVFMATIAPPPFPTKLIVLAAGAFNLKLRTFVLGGLTGRLLRYGLEGYLGARLGQQAAQVLKAQYPLVSVGLIGAVVILVLVRRFRPSPQSYISPPDAKPQ